jgi:GNAT superfamily N-acetyltransferase
MKLHIREAREADLSAVLALYAQPDLDGSAEAALSVAEASVVWQQFAKYPNYRLFVAQQEHPEGHDAPIVGSYALLVMHNLAHRGAPSAVAEDVVVSGQHRRFGVGRQLMAHAMAQARAAGCYKLALSSNSRREAAHAFYRSLGFAQHGLSFLVDTSQEPA